MKESETTAGKRRRKMSRNSSAAVEQIKKNRRFLRTSSRTLGIYRVWADAQPTTFLLWRSPAAQLTLLHVAARMNLVFRLWSLWHGTAGFLRSSSSPMEAAQDPIRHSWHSRRHGHHRVYLHRLTQRAFAQATSPVSKTPLSCA